MPRENNGSLSHPSNSIISSIHFLPFLRLKNSLHFLGTWASDQDWREKEIKFNHASITRRLRGENQSITLGRWSWWWGKVVVRRERERERRNKGREPRVKIKELYASKVSVGERSQWVIQSWSFPLFSLHSFSLPSSSEVMQVWKVDDYLTRAVQKLSLPLLPNIPTFCRCSGLQFGL